MNGVIELLTVDPAELKVESPFCDLFPISPKVRAEVVASIRKTGFHRGKPIDVWNGVIIDGHTRQSAAIEVGIGSVPVVEHEFADEDEALAYAIASQRERRNITDADLARCIKAVDKRKSAGRPEKLASCDANSGKSAEQTARIVGTSTRKVEKVRAIIDHAAEDPTIEKEVLEGSKSINKAATEIRSKKRAKKKSQGNPVIPAANVSAPRPPLSSLTKLTPDDEAWLASFPLRAKVVSHRFDEDALAYRHFEAFLKAIHPDLLRLLGERSEVGMSVLHRSLFRLGSVVPISQWIVCVRCGGTGIKNGLCRPCLGGGYQIPGL